MKCVNIVRKTVGWRHVPYMFSVGFCRHFSKIFCVIFPPHWTHHLFTLDVAVMWPFQAKCTVTQNDWIWQILGKKRSGIHDLTNIIACAISVLFITRNVLVVFENPGIWPFVRNVCIDENFKVAPVICGGNNEPCILTTRSVDLKTPKGLHSPGLSRSGGRLKKKIMNTVSDTWAVTYSGCWWQEQTKWNSQSQT
jgi:hypothetical protein